MTKIYRRYNYPWSGRLGRLTDCCIYCGKKDGSFRVSSFGDRCLDRECAIKAHNGEYIIDLKNKMNENYEKLARQWCKNNKIDYDKTIELFSKNLGPMEGELANFSEEDINKCIVYMII